MTPRITRLNAPGLVDEIPHGDLDIEPLSAIERLDPPLDLRPEILDQSHLIVQRGRDRLVDRREAAGCAPFAREGLEFGEIATSMPIFITTAPRERAPRSIRPC